MPDVIVLYKEELKKHEQRQHNPHSTITQHKLIPTFKIEISTDQYADKNGRHHRQQHGFLQDKEKQSTRTSDEILNNVAVSLSFWL